MYPVYIAEGVIDSKRVNIIATSDRNLFTITEKGGTCTVKAQVTDGNNNPVAENFIQNSGGKIVYKPYMRKRGSTENETGVTFSMSLYSNAGVPINSAITESGNTFTITEAGIRAYKGAVYSITGTI